jgi:hypothetical protein
VLPVIFQRTLALFAKGDEISVAELAGVVEQDVVIAGHLVSIANSALYSRAGSVCCVRRAIARLGIHKTRNALPGLSVSRPFRNIRFPRNWSSARFNSHSLAGGDRLSLVIPNGRNEIEAIENEFRVVMQIVNNHVIARL